MADNQKNSKYMIIEELGQCSFGKRFKVKNMDNNKFYAIKKIPINKIKEEDLNKIKNEVKILSNFNNEYIVKYYESFIDNNDFNIVMEYCEGLDLRKFIDENKEKNQLIDKCLIYDIISDICLGIKEIHNKNIIHRDLKPENLFISENSENLGIIIKIGDFGISKQLNNNKDFTNTQIGTLAYMAPEILKGENYNNKVDIWSLGCIIQELCTLDLCFEGNSFITIFNKIMELNHKKINQKIYGIDLQNLIDSLLEMDEAKRPDIINIIKILNKTKENSKIISKNNLFLNNEIYEDFIIGENIQKSLELVHNVIREREKKFNYIKSIFMVSIPEAIVDILKIPLNIISYFHEPTSRERIEFPGLKNDSTAYKLNCSIDNLFSSLWIKIVYENQDFIKDNSIIINYIDDKITKKINDRFDINLFNEKIIVYDEEDLNIKINKIVKKLMLNKNIINNYNILLLGNTNVGKSTLINEFLKLENGEKAKESDGGPTSTNDFTPYIKKKNDIQYTLYDTNGITNVGENSFDNKIKNTLNQIKDRIKENNPNKLIHCIWYCFSGSNIQECDKTFIEKLLNIDAEYSIPIIFVHSKTFSKEESKTCKKGLKNYLLEFFNRDESKIEKYLKNYYINILSREEKNDEDEEDDDDKEEGYIRRKAFGLDKLESISKTEIKEKGMKSALCQSIKYTIFTILINGALNLVFSQENIYSLMKIIKEDIKKYFDEIIKIINNNRFKLSDDTKINNIESLNRIFNSFNTIKDSLKNDIKSSLTKENLKRDTDEFIKKIYNQKTIEFKNKMNYNNFYNKVEHAIYANIIHSSNDIANNLINLHLNSCIFQIIKKGILEQLFNKKEEMNKMFDSLYSKLVFGDIEKNKK